RYFDQLDAQTKDVFVANGPFGAPLNLNCIAPNAKAADEIVAQLDEYFDVPDSPNLIPPWSPIDTRSPEQAARHRLARRTYYKLQHAGIDAYNDPQLKDLNQQITAARRRGDTDEA